MSSYIPSLQVMAVASLAVFFTIKTLKEYYYQNQNQSDKDEQSCAVLARKMAEKGDRSGHTENWIDAINFYTAAIKLDGSNATYYKKRSAANVCITRLNHAIEDYNTASALDGIHPCRQHKHHTVIAVNVCRQHHHHANVWQEDHHDVNVWQQDMWPCCEICQNPDCDRQVSYGYPVSRQ